MTSSLVGSEMCIRDRTTNGQVAVQAEEIAVRIQERGRALDELKGHLLSPVSYTHLTLPTICSV
eukprot:5221431-Prorocentrum_lima.AAC.1